MSTCGDWRRATRPDLVASRQLVGRSCCRSVRRRSAEASQRWKHWNRNTPQPLGCGASQEKLQVSGSFQLLLASHCTSETMPRCQEFQTVAAGNGCLTRPAFSAIGRSYGVRQTQAIFVQDIRDALTKHRVAWLNRPVKGAPFSHFVREFMNRFRAPG